MKGIFLALSGLLLWVAPATVQGQSGWGDNFYYTINPDETNTITITGYTGPGGTVAIPTNINGLFVTIIGDFEVLDNNALTNVTIGTNITSIRWGAFLSCFSLTAITVAANNPFYTTTNGVLFDKSMATLVGFPIGKGGNYAIPDNVTTIGDGAFSECYRLTNITIPSNVTNMGQFTFYECSGLTAVIIPASVTSIGVGLFDECENLASAPIPGNVVSIGGSSFFETSLTNVTIPASTTNIGSGAFADCTSLAAIAVDSTNAFYSSASGVLFDKSQTTLVQYPAGRAVGSYTIPASVTDIANGAFNAASFTNVTIPGNVTNIENDAFGGCPRLTNVTILSGVASIDLFAFAYCTSLTSVTIAGSITNIGYEAFLNCANLSSVYFAGNAPIADTSVFQSDTNVTVYYLPGTSGWSNTFAGIPAELESLQGSGDDYDYTVNPDNPDTITITEYIGGEFAPPAGAVIIPTSINSHLVTGIGDGQDSVFGESGVTGVTFPASVTSIADSAFYDCASLTSVTIPSSVTNIGANAFENCTRLTNASIPNGVNGIGDDAFSGCSVTSVVIPASVTSMGDSLFSNCRALTNVTISDTITNVAAETFEYCSRLINVTIPGSVVSIEPASFQGCSSLANISIPNGLTNIGVSAFGGCSSLTSIVIPDSVSTIGAQAFGSCSSLTNVTIPASVSTIGFGPFIGCASLTAILVNPENLSYGSLDGVLFDYNLTTLIQYPAGTGGNYIIPGSVTNIGEDAFSFCGLLTNVMIPNSVTTIGDGAFDNCRSLTNVTIPASVSSIGELEFAFCTNLTNITIPGSVTSIGEAAFDGCLTLTSVTIPGSVTNIGEGAFEYCTNLTNVTLSEGVSSIGEWAFAQCFSLSTVTIAGSVTNMALGVFEDCDGLTSVYFGGNAPTVAPNMFGIANGIVYYLPGTSGWGSTLAGLPAVMLNPPSSAGSLQVTISPAGAVAAGAQWQVDGGIPQPNGAIVLGLSVGNHTVSFSTVNGWLTPTTQAVSVGINSTATAGGLYTPLSIPPNGLLLLTNGYGTIQHGPWPASLVIGKHYTVKAVPKTKNVFLNWAGGTNQPFPLLSSSASYTFAMESNLVLEASFVTNVYLELPSAYRGLFAPANAARQQTNSGSFAFSVTRSGAISGKLDLDGFSVPLSGRFEADGTAEIVSIPAHEIPPLTTSLQLDFADQSVSGTVSDGAFTAALSGYRHVFSKSDKATEFEGHYTLIIPGTNDSTVGPYGTSYATVKVNDLGNITLAGYLADGTFISQSSVVSQDGLWPLYINLYGGKGSLWGWNCFTNHTLANASSISWINSTNSARTAVYRSGFTNQETTLIGGLYKQSRRLPTDLTAILEGGDLPFAIINGVTVASSDKISFINSLDETNKLKLRIKRSTGTITGSFANPDDPKQTIKIHGVILQGQTNAQGYFLGTNQSGAFMLGAP
ncbi:MAG: leucine-rich repeat protein [Verrucomicrobiota bacterium]